MKKRETRAASLNRSRASHSIKLLKMMILSCDESSVKNRGEHMSDTYKSVFDWVSTGLSCEE